MIDTVVIRVHNLRKHHELVKFVNLNFKGTSKNTMIIPKNEADEFTKSPFVDEKLMIDYFRNSESGTHLVRYKSQKKLNNSGHYYLNAFENRDKDFLEFNFSIPKYLYGTNIKLFVEHHMDKNFTYYQNKSLEYNLNLSYTRLMNFIRHFFKAEFPIDKIVDFSDVEINRIDLCYNQFFNSSKEALEYLEYQKQIRRNHARRQGENFREYETSLMYVTKRYSLKIYHKGSEYKVHDIKEHLKINKEKNSNRFKTKELQKLADRILRYEITFRNGMLTYFFNQYIFRKNSPSHQNRFKIYKEVESINLKNERIAKKIGNYKYPKSKEEFISSNPYIKVTQENRRIHKYVLKLINRQRLFMCYVSPEVQEFNTQTLTYNYFEPRALFSKELFMLCSKYLLKFIKDFQVHEKPSLSIVDNLIDNFNSENYHKLPKKEMLIFYALLKNQTFEDIRKDGLYSRATIYRFIKRFKQIGITQNNLIPIQWMVVSTDLSEYHSTLMANSNIL